MKIHAVLALLCLALASAPARASWLLRRTWTPTGEVSAQSIEQVELATGSPRTPLRLIPSMIAEHGAELRDRVGTYEEILYSEAGLPSKLRALARRSVNRGRAAWPGSEVRTLVNQGPSANRIDLTIVGDGYTSQEKDRFFADAQRITQDLFVGKTFSSYLPLFNVHAVFVPSNESGITDLTRKDTALGLYRSPAGSKRGILPGNAQAIRRAVALAPATDYPIVIANDDYYGGLGGEFAITTRSLNSGTLVLRHELGHNFGQVGEEYDGGQVYSGANFSRSPALSWAHWINGPARLNQAEYLSGEYLWRKLGPQPLVIDFDSKNSAPGSRIQILLSTVGWSTPDDVHVLLDGQRVAVSGVFTDDRSFFTLEPNQSLASGRHRLEFRENRADGDNVLAFAEVYALAPDYELAPDLVEGFPVFSDPGSLTGYRPTHDGCIMRNMRLERFCVVDQENFWLQFLKRVELIDELRAQPAPGGMTHVSARGPELAETTVRWFALGSDGSAREIPQLANQREWDAAPSQRGRYRVLVEFRTPEVRQANSRFTTQKEIQF